MKLLHVVDTMDLKKGGVSQALQTMANGIANLGIYNEVISLDGPKKELLNNSFILHTLGQSQNMWGYSNKLVPWLLKNICRFDVIIIHGLWLYNSYGVIRALSQLKRQPQYNDVKSKTPKLYVMPHGMLDPYFQYSGQRKIKAIRNWIYWKLIEGKTINQSEGVLFASKEECRLANQPFKPYHPKKQIVVGLGVAEPPAMSGLMFESFLEKCPGVKNNQYILFLGRIDSKKGIDMLINAYARMVERERTHGRLNNTQMPNLPKLVIAGPGLDTVYGRKIKKMVFANSHINTHVFFPGMLNGNAKWGAFYGCEVFVLPSHQENFGIAVVEALACSKPVLLSNQVNISAEIKEKNAGFVEDDTSEGVNKLLSAWLNTSGEGRLDMGVKARLCFESDFATGPAVSKLIKAVSAV
jgi:glycosyltransferase involved in cell wall biosynthesis